MNKVLLVLVLFACVGAYATSPLVVRLTPFGDALVRFSIYNNGTETTKFLPWGTPLEGFTTDLFHLVDQDNQTVAEYVGMMARRSWPPMPEDFLHLPAQAEISKVVDLSEVYQFSTAGRYHIIYLMKDYNNDFEGAQIEKVSSVFVSEQKVMDSSEKHKIHAQERSAMVTYTNCNSDQIKIIQANVPKAQTEAVKAYNCLTGGTCKTAVTTWFGSISATDTTYEKNCYTGINKALANGMNSYCNPSTCPASTYAFVYPTDKNQIVYLCSEFWNRPLERVNTIVHEMSHFNAIAGTQDYAYGEINCKNLAKTNSPKATHNADNVCYFSQDASR